MFRPKPGKADIDFLLYLFKTKLGKHLLTLASPGGAGRNKTLGQSEFLRIELPCPPYEEQIRIAEILATWDQAIETTERLIANSQGQKKALMQQLLTGKLRLPTCDGEWKYFAFDEVFRVANDKSAQVPKKEYLQAGNVPIVDQGQSDIAGYTNSSNTYNDVPVIIFGDHTRAIKWVDFCFCPGADGTQVLSAKEGFDPRFSYFLLSNAEIPDLGYSRHMRELKQIEFRAPTCLNEQRDISNILSNAESAEKALLNLAGKLRSEKTALMQQLLTGKRRVKIEREVAA